MAIKVFIKRKIKNGQLQEASRLISKTRYGAMGQKGYISSETLTDYSDPNRILVTSMWQELDNWKTWKNSEQRKENEVEFKKIVEGSTEYEIYDLGMKNE